GERVDERQPGERSVAALLHLLGGHPDRGLPDLAERHVPRCARQPSDDCGYQDGQVVHACECHGGLSPAFGQCYSNRVRHCERSEAIQSRVRKRPGLLRRLRRLARTDQSNGSSLIIAAWWLLPAQNVTGVVVLSMKMRRMLVWCGSRYSIDCPVAGSRRS